MSERLDRVTVTLRLPDDVYEGLMKRYWEKPLEERGTQQQYFDSLFKAVRPVAPTKCPPGAVVKHVRLLRATYRKLCAVAGAEAVGRTASASLIDYWRRGTGETVARRARKAMTHDIYRFAKKCAVDYDRYREWELGKEKKSLSVYEISRVAAVLGLEPEELADAKGFPKYA